MNALEVYTRWTEIGTDIRTLMMREATGLAKAKFVDRKIIFADNIYFDYYFFSNDKLYVCLRGSHHNPVVELDEMSNGEIEELIKSIIGDPI